MAHPIKELAKLTTKSKQIDGMGFGGQAPDNLEIAGILALPHPDTKEKLSKKAYYLARFLYCGDAMCKVRVKSALLAALREEDAQGINDVTLLKMVNAAIREYTKPEHKKDRYGGLITNEQGDPVIKPLSARQFADRIGVNRSSVKEIHRETYARLYQEICNLNSEVMAHILGHTNE